MTEHLSDFNAGSNQQTYDRLTLSLRLGLRRQLFIAVCDDVRERDRLIHRLHHDLAPPPQAYPTLVTLTLNESDPDPIAQIAQWLKRSPPVVEGQRVAVPMFQIIGVEYLTRQSLVVQRLFFNYLQNVERNLPRLESGILFWMPRPWVRGLAQSAPDFWRCRTAVFEFEGDPIPTPSPQPLQGADLSVVDFDLDLDVNLDAGELDAADAVDAPAADVTAALDLVPDLVPEEEDTTPTLLAELTADPLPTGNPALPPPPPDHESPIRVSASPSPTAATASDGRDAIAPDLDAATPEETAPAIPSVEVNPAAIALDSTPAQATEPATESATPVSTSAFPESSLAPPAESTIEAPVVVASSPSPVAPGRPPLPPPSTTGLHLPLSEEELWQILHHDISQQLTPREPYSSPADERPSLSEEDATESPDTESTLEAHSPTHRPDGREPGGHESPVPLQSPLTDDPPPPEQPSRYRDRPPLDPDDPLYPPRARGRATQTAERESTMLQAVRKVLRQPPGRERNTAVSVVDRVAADAPPTPLPTVADLDPLTLQDQIERLHKQQAPPALLANAYRTLGNLYRDRIERGIASAEDLRAAIQSYEQVLVWLHETSPLWTDVLNDLGNLYWMLSRQSSSLDAILSNLQQAIQAYQLALNKINIQSQTASYTMVQSNLGAAYGDLARYQDTADNLQRSVQAYQQALRYRKPEDEPQRYALTQNNLGTTYWNLAQHHQPKVYLKQAIAAYSEALRYYSPEAEPMNHAMIQNNLGTAYWNLAQHERPREWLMLALAAYRTALRYRTRQGAPGAYAATQNNLGTAYWHLASHANEDAAARLDYLQQAIAAYDAAIAIAHDLQDHGDNSPPLNFDICATYNNLGLAHSQLANDGQIQLSRDRRQTHLESALSYHLKALAGWQQRPDLRDATLKCVVQTIRACYTHGGISGQNTALSQVPGHLLPDLLPQL